MAFTPFPIRRPVQPPLATLKALIAQGHPQTRSLDPGFGRGIPPHFVQAIRNALLPQAPAAVRPSMAGEHGAGGNPVPYTVRPQGEHGAGGNPTPFTVRPDMAGEHGGGFAPPAAIHSIPPDLLQRIQQLSGAFHPQLHPAFPINPYSGGAGGPVRPPGGWTSVDTFLPWTLDPRNPHRPQ